MTQKQAKSSMQNLPVERVEILHTKLEAQAERAAKHREYHIKSHVVHHSYITKKIKDDRYQYTIEQTRQELTRSERVLSLVIHYPMLENLSELMANTIARPIGILAGGILTIFIGIIILVTANNSGFEVTNGTYGIIYILGYAIGVLAESVALIANKLRSNKKR